MPALLPPSLLPDIITMCCAGTEYCAVRIYTALSGLIRSTFSRSSPFPFLGLGASPTMSLQAHAAYNRARWRGSDVVKCFCPPILLLSVAIGHPSTKPNNSTVTSIACARQTYAR